MKSHKRQASRRKPKSKSKRVSRGKKQVRSHRKYSGNLFRPAGRRSSLCTRNPADPMCL